MKYATLLKTTGAAGLAVAALDRRAGPGRCR